MFVLDSQRQERCKEMLLIFRAIANNKPHIVAGQLYAELIAHPSSRFWVTSSRALHVVRTMESKGEKALEHMHETKRRMYREIYRRYQIRKRVQRHADSKLIIEMIVREPAPEFYMTVGSAIAELSKYRKWLRLKR